MAEAGAGAAASAAEAPAIQAAVAGEKDCVSSNGSSWFTEHYMLCRLDESEAIARRRWLPIPSIVVLSCGSAFTPLCAPAC